MAIVKTQTPAVKNLTAAGTALANYALVSQPQSQVTVDITGTWVATILFEGTIDGANWVGVSAKASNGTADATRVITTAANGMWFIEAEGLKQVRVRCSAYTSGTIITAIIKSNRGGLQFT